MKIYISIDWVDGETSTNTNQRSAEGALNFLSHNDHEGSTISAYIQPENPEEIYKILRWIDEGSKK